MPTTLVGAQGDAMRAAASNQAGAMAGFMGMGMASQAGGMNAQNLFAMGQRALVPGRGKKLCTATAECSFSWKLDLCCKTVNTGKFCTNCASPKPRGWLDPVHVELLIKGNSVLECRKTKAKESLYTNVINADGSGRSKNPLNSVQTAESF